MLDILPLFPYINHPFFSLEKLSSLDWALLPLAFNWVISSAGTSGKWEGEKREHGGKKEESRPLAVSFSSRACYKPAGSRHREAFRAPAGRSTCERRRQNIMVRKQSAIRPQNPLFSSVHSQGGLGKQAFIWPGARLCFPALSYSS